MLDIARPLLDFTSRRVDAALRTFAAALGLALATAAWAQTTPADGSTGGPIRLRQPASSYPQSPQPAAGASQTERNGAQPPLQRDRQDAVGTDGRELQGTPSPRGPGARGVAGPREFFGPAPMGEFEEFVQRLAFPYEVRRFGAELMTPAQDPTSAEHSAVVPPDYAIATGDELVVTIWGSVDADLRLPVDRSGRITIPRVGPVMVAGVRYADVTETVRRRVAQVFRNFDLSVSLGQLRGVRVYVTGFVARPGTYSVSSLATVAQVLMRAGGPSAAGSFRQISLRRAGQPVANFDLYDLLLRGDRAGDRVVAADDVVHVEAVGPQVALIGSVNKPAIFELKPGETVADVLRMAGGFTAVADRKRLAVERLDERNSVRITQLELPAALSAALGNGDVLRAFSAVDSAQPVQRQNKRVRVEGEVLRPGEYVLPAASSIADAIQAAGGLTASAYLFGTEFSRESVRVTQQENYERALRDLETDFTRAATTQRATTADEAAAQAARANATARLVERLRAVKPTGRIVLQMQPDSRELPNLALEDGDRLYVPPRPTTVGVFGSVFNGGSYLFGEGRSVEDYLRLAGGPTKGADADSTFVIRANGSVVSGRQQTGGWFGGGSGLGAVNAQAGDTIFVPEEANKTTFVQNAKDWTQILYQFGVGLAAIATIGR